MRLASRFGRYNSIRRERPLTPPRPLRTGEQTAALWIAPYIDNQDVYHQPSSVFFVIKPSAWGKPRIN